MTPFGGVTARSSRNGVVVRVTPQVRETATVAIRLDPSPQVVSLLNDLILWVERGYTVELTAYDPDHFHDPGRLKVGTVGEPDPRLFP